MKKISNKGQAEIMDGLILMIIAAVCSTVLLTTSSNYGSIPLQIYEETYANKLAQNTLLSLYHITHLTDATGREDPSSPFYKKSIMVAVSQDLAAGDLDLTQSRVLVKNVLEAYTDPVNGLDWEFMFAILPNGVSMDENHPKSMISTDLAVINAATFKENVGAPYCASAALTYQPTSTSSCGIGGSAGAMCYAIFEVCVWQP